MCAEMRSNMVKKIVNNDMSEVLASKCALVVFRLPGVGLAI